MGFRQGGYMTVWSAEPSKSGSTTRVRLSSSRKNKKTDEYEQDFSGFCTFIGQAHEMADGSTPTAGTAAPATKKKAALAEEGEVDEDDLPF